jgi:hypothetical protein
MNHDHIPTYVHRLENDLNNAAAWPVRAWVLVRSEDTAIRILKSRCPFRTLYHIHPGYGSLEQMTEFVDSDT